MRPDGDSPRLASASAPAFDISGAAEIIAHRGFSAVAPENTLSALDAALRAGADALEFDVQISADGHPLLLHDATLDRTTDGCGAVQDVAWAELARLDAGTWFSEAFRGEPLPAFTRALERLRGRVERLYVELKDVRRPEDVDRVVDVVEHEGWFAGVVFISIEWDLLARIRERAPSAAIGYIVTEVEHAEAALALAAGDRRALVDFDYRIPVEHPELAAAARADGIEMAAWTVDDPGDASRLLQMGIPRITTNQVARMVAWKAGLGGGAERPGPAGR